MRVEAWRIRMHVVKGRELMPEQARAYCKRALERTGYVDHVGERAAKIARIKPLSDFD